MSCLLCLGEKAAQLFRRFQPTPWISLLFRETRCTLGRACWAGFAVPSQSSRCSAVWPLLRESGGADSTFVRLKAAKEASGCGVHGGGGSGPSAIRGPRAWVGSTAADPAIPTIPGPACRRWRSWQPGFIHNPRSAMPHVLAQPPASPAVGARRQHPRRRQQPVQASAASGAAPPALPQLGGGCRWAVEVMRHTLTMPQVGFRGGGGWRRLQLAPAVSLQRLEQRDRHPVLRRRRLASS